MDETDETKTTKESTMPSVIIPAHNEEAMIERVIQAVLADGVKDLECVVVPNACSDRTAEISKGMENQKVRRGLGANHAFLKEPVIVVRHLYILLAITHTSGAVCQETARLIGIASCLDSVHRIEPKNALSIQSILSKSP